MINIGDRLCVKGDWDGRAVPAGRETLLLRPSADRQGNPHMAYTRSMLEIMESLIPPATTVADLGAGNGILSLAAAKLGATKVTAYENRPEVREIAQGNVEVNQLTSIIKVLGSDFTQTGIPRCDLVLCNIDILETLKAAISQARESVLAGGHFVCVLLESDLLELDATTGAELRLVGQEAVPDRWVRAVFGRV